MHANLVDVVIIIIVIISIVIIYCLDHGNNGTYADSSKREELKSGHFVLRLGLRGAGRGKLMLFHGGQHFSRM